MFHWIMRLVRGHPNEMMTCAGLLLAFVPLIFAATISMLQSGGLLGPNGLPDLFTIEQSSTVPMIACYVVGITMTSFGLWRQWQGSRR